MILSCPSIALSTCVAFFVATATWVCCRDNCCHCCDQKVQQEQRNEKESLLKTITVQPPLEMNQAKKCAVSEH